MKDCEEYVTRICKKSYARGQKIYIIAVPLHLYQQAIDSCGHQSTTVSMTGYKTLSMHTSFGSVQIVPANYTSVRQLWIDSLDSLTLEK